MLRLLFGISGLRGDHRGSCLDKGSVSQGILYWDSVKKVLDNGADIER